MMKTSGHARRDDRVIFYFSGHGSPEGLAPADYRGEDGSHLLLHSAIKTILRQSLSRQILLVIDACHAQGSEDAAYIGAVTDLLASYNNSGMTILSSSNADQSSFEYAESGKSFFTHYLLQGIQQEFADYNKDQIITLREAYEYARLDVHVMTEGAQTPQEGGDADPHIVLRLLED